MTFWTLLEVTSTPILEILTVAVAGAFMATDHCNLLSADTRRSLNKIVFMVFTPSLMFSSLATNVTLRDLISWWFMPANVGLTFLLGGTFGWILVKMLSLEPHIEALVIATCSSGNLGNLFLVVIPAICKEKGSPFGNEATCTSNGLSYVSFSMALGAVYIWTYTFHLIRTSASKYRVTLRPRDSLSDLNAAQVTLLLKSDSTDLIEATECRSIISEESKHGLRREQTSMYRGFMGILSIIVELFLPPPTVAMILGFIVGATKFLKNLLVGDEAPLRFVEGSLNLLGSGTIPCITLILGGNLIRGLRGSKVKLSVLLTITGVRYVLLPALGMWIVVTAEKLHLLPSDPLFRYILMMQYVVPPAMNIGTMVEMFDAGQEECSVIFLWMYLTATFAFTFWSTLFMSML